MENSRTQNGFARFCTLGIINLNDKQRRYSGSVTGVPFLPVSYHRTKYYDFGSHFTAVNR